MPKGLRRDPFLDFVSPQLSVFVSLLRYRSTASTRMSSIFRYELEATAHEGSIPARRKRGAPEDFERDVETKRPAIINPTTSRIVSPFAAKKKPRKRPNYLEHGDRCRIIKRVDRGETQASLAREFGVTRAAICQLYKKRDEVLSRGDLEGDSNGRSPIEDAQVAPSRELDITSAVAYQKTKSRPEVRPSDKVEKDTKLRPPTVEARSSSVTLLLKTMKDTESSETALNRAATRLTLYVAYRSCVPITEFGGKYLILFVLLK